MTNEQLAEIERRLQAATPGPWVAVGGSLAAGSPPRFHCIGTFLHDNREANSELAANAPADIAALISEVRRLQAELDAAQTFESPSLGSKALDELRARNWERVNSPHRPSAAGMGDEQPAGE